jgi:hypothetical protein
MANIRHKRPRPGSKVVLVGLPTGFLDDFPEEERRAIRAVVGKPIRLREYDENGRAVLEFSDSPGSFHTLYVGPELIKRMK